MRRRIKLSARRELTTVIRQRYQSADRVGKKMILDDFTKVTGYQPVPNENVVYSSGKHLS